MIVHLSSDIFMYVCMFVCMYVCMYICIYVYVSVCVCVCVCARARLWSHVEMVALAYKCLTEVGGFRVGFF